MAPRMTPVFLANANFPTRRALLQSILFKLGPSRPYADVAACIEAGADAVVGHGRLAANAKFLQKPVTPSKLSAMVRQTLDDS